MAKLLKHNYDKDTLDKAKQIYTDCFYSLKDFSNFFLRDDAQNQFMVPSRKHMVLTDIPPHQDSILESLSSICDSRRLAIASPRGFMKSTSCSVKFPLWASLFGHFKEILIVSNSETLALEFMRSIKVNYESNDRIHRYFGKLWSDKWTESHLITKNKVSIRGVGWGSQIRGFRPDCIIIDDIETDETVASEDVRRKMKDWLLKAAMNSLAMDGCIVWVGTFISRLALFWEWAHNPPQGWKVLIQDCYKDGMEEPGHELWPEVWSHQKLQNKKSEIGSWAFSSEYRNDPIPSEGNRFDPKTFRFFTDDDLKGKDTGVYISIDPAFSEDSSADYGVIMVGLHDNQDNLYVDRYYRKHTNSRKLIDEFKRIYKLYQGRIRAVGIEDVGPQKGFYQQLTNECIQEGIYAPFKKLTGMMNTSHGMARSKKDRITYAIQPRLECGKVLLRKEQEELYSELVLYPETSHDDLVDALAYLISLIEPLQDYTSQDSFESEPDTELPYRGTTGYGEDYGEKETVYSFNF